MINGRFNLVPCCGSVISSSIRDFSLFRSFQTGTGFHPPSYAKVVGAALRRYSGRDVKLKTHLHLLSSSRMCGALPALPIRLHGVVLSFHLTTKFKNGSSLTRSEAALTL